MTTTKIKLTRLAPGVYTHEGYEIVQQEWLPAAQRGGWDARQWNLTYPGEREADDTYPTLREAREAIADHKEWLKENT